MFAEKEVNGMKKANIALAVILAVFIVLGLYFYFGTDMKVHAAAAREGEGIRCELTLSNGSLFKYEYLEFILLGPEGAQLSENGLTGQDIGMLSQARTTVMLDNFGESPCRIEIGYYVLGMRRHVTVTVE